MFIEKNWKEDKFLIIGLDEVGRGPLAGPVVAGGARFKGDRGQLRKVLSVLERMKVTDSKKLSSVKRREILTDLGIDLSRVENKDHLVVNELNSHVELFLYECAHDVIDEINILQASLLSMKYCAETLANGEVAKAYFDGNRVPENMSGNIEAFSIIKGDSKSALIALASIFAKEYRDFLMEKYALTYPGYGFEKHAGYPTAFHKEAIKNKGVTEIHRKSFRGVKEFV